MHKLSDFQRDIRKLLQYKKSGINVQYKDEIYLSDRVDINKITNFKPFKVKNGRDDVRLYRATYKGEEIIIKGYITSYQTQIICHEFTIGKCVEEVDLPQFGKVIGILRKIDMGKLTNGLCISRGIVYKYYDFPTLSKWINRQRSAEEITKMIQHIMLVLESAHNYCKFTHYDLYPSNILVGETSKVQVYKIPINDKDYVEISSKYYPIIIDYGMSFAEYNQSTVGIKGLKCYGIDCVSNPSYDIMRLIRTLVAMCRKKMTKWAEKAISELFIKNDLSENLLYMLINNPINGKNNSNNKSYQYWPYNDDISYINLADYLEKNPIVF